MRVLITGANGFVGRALGRELLRRGRRVRAGWCAPVGASATRIRASTCSSAAAGSTRSASNIARWSSPSKMAIDSRATDSGSTAVPSSGNELRPIGRNGHWNTGTTYEFCILRKVHH